MRAGRRWLVRTSTAADASARLQLRSAWQVAAVAAGERAMQSLRGASGQQARHVAGAVAGPFARFARSCAAALRRPCACCADLQ